MNAYCSSGWTSAWALLGALAGVVPPVKYLKKEATSRWLGGRDHRRGRAITAGVANG